MQIVDIDELLYQMYQQSGYQSDEDLEIIDWEQEHGSWSNYYSGLDDISIRDFFQEYSKESAVAEFCSTEYGVDFPMFATVKVRGKKAHPFYKKLIYYHIKTKAF